MLCLIYVYVRILLYVVGSEKRGPIAHSEFIRIIITM